MNQKKAVAFFLNFKTNRSKTNAVLPKPEMPPADAPNPPQRFSHQIAPLSTLAKLTQHK